MAEASGGEVVVYEDPGGEIRVDVRLEHEAVWLSLGQLAELFGRDKSVISRHLHNVFASGELERTATVAKNATVTPKRQTSRYFAAVFRAPLAVASSLRVLHLLARGAPKLLIDNGIVGLIY